MHPNFLTRLDSCALRGADQRRLCLKNHRELHEGTAQRSKFFSAPELNFPYFLEFRTLTIRYFRFRIIELQPGVHAASNIPIVHFIVDINLAMIVQS